MTKKLRQESGTDYQKMPTSKELRKYSGGISTNWSIFYKPIRVEGLELMYQAPFFDLDALDQPIIFGLRMACEDNIIIFKVNDDETGVYILTGSGRITGEMLKRDPMLGRPVF